VQGRTVLQTIVLSGGPAPVHSVSADLDGDRQPAWYFSDPGFDFRGAVRYPIGPVLVRGRQTLIVKAIDEQGCEASTSLSVVIAAP
jgi:hypothetical protein